MPTLEVKNVSYAYEKDKAVLQNISVELETGKLYAILGHQLKMCGSPPRWTPLPFWNG